MDKINKEFDLKVTEKDIDAKNIEDELKYDQDMATKSMVGGTPTIYVDGVWDKTRKKLVEQLQINGVVLKILIITENRDKIKEIPNYATVYNAEDILTGQVRDI